MRCDNMLPAVTPEYDVMQWMIRLCRLPGALRQAVCMSAALTLAAGAAAQSLTWHFEQIYSNPDGNAQFAVVYEYANNQNQDYLTGASFSSVHNSAEHAH